MISLCEQVLTALRGKTLATAESCTGGGIGAAITAVPGSSVVYKGGIISYQNAVKRELLSVDADVLETYGPVSQQVAVQMASGVRTALNCDIAVSVTGLAGPGGDDFGNPVGTVYIGYATEKEAFAQKHIFSGSRDEVRIRAIECALKLILAKN